MGRGGTPPPPQPYSVPPWVGSECNLLAGAGKVRGGRAASDREKGRPAWPLEGLGLTSVWLGDHKNCAHFSICACHLCARGHANFFCVAPILMDDPEWDPIFHLREIMPI